MDPSKLGDVARTLGAPIQDVFHRTTYRCAAYLDDGLYLPCVVVAGPDALVDLAIRRFQETIEDNESGPHPPGRPIARNLTYPDIVRYFVTEENRLSHYHIARLEPSPFAIPRERLVEVRGETRMSWTAFTAVMGDGHEFSFGTTHSLEFFHMPVGYTGRDVVRIDPPKQVEGTLFRERPFFTCFVQGL